MRFCLDCGSRFGFYDQTCFECMGKKGRDQSGMFQMILEELKSLRKDLDELKGWVHGDPND